MASLLPLILHPGKCLSLLLAALESLRFHGAHANDQVDSGLQFFLLVICCSPDLGVFKTLLRNHCMVSSSAVQKYEIVRIQLPSSCKLEMNPLNLIYNHILLSFHTVIISIS